ncbi:MAG: LptF/LptG family permease [Chitinophagaceae bacterium]|nr:LptF/LptG family permease [Oligoflexus sp.]
MTLFFYFFFEIIPQFITVFCVLSSVIVVTQLVRISEVLVTFGLSFENLFLPFLFILMPLISYIVPIALLFAVLLGFSRLSSDGEYSAMTASGYSLKRAMLPIFFIATACYALSLATSVYFEPWANRERVTFYHRKVETQLDNMLKYQMKQGVFQDDFLGYVLYAEKISPDHTHLENVMMAPGKDSQKEHFTLLAPTATIEGAVATGDLRMNFSYGIIYTVKPDTPEVSVMKFKQMDLDLFRILREQKFGNDSEEDDFRNQGSLDLWRSLPKLKASSNPKDKDLYLKSLTLFHQRISFPFSCFAFSFFAMVFGIQDERRGKNYAYLLVSAVMIIGYVFIMWFRNLSEKGEVTAALGAWLPQIIMLILSLFMVYQRNRLPASESVFDYRHFPFFERYTRSHAKPAQLRK